MNINFPTETFEALINRANAENKSAQALAVELLKNILHNEENNELKPNQGAVSVHR